MLAVSILFFIGLVVVQSLGIIIGMLDRRVFDSGRLQLALAGVILAGFAGGGAWAWSHVPSVWHLSFTETMAASADAVKYGHEVEHFAENTMLMVLVASMVGGVVAAVAAAVVLRIRRPRPVCPC